MDPVGQRSRGLRSKVITFFNENPPHVARHFEGTVTTYPTVYNIWGFEPPTDPGDGRKGQTLYML